MDEYEGLESLERVALNSLVARDGLMGEWSHFKDAMFDTSNGRGMPYILTAQRTEFVSKAQSGAQNWSMQI